MEQLTVQSLRFLAGFQEDVKIMVVVIVVVVVVLLLLIIIIIIIVNLALGDAC